ncbi:hypothetical protein [Flavobacterium lacus]|uniref:Secreted protein (Por secretion system target) n=1 Tax=Flavobacterium lacus TaxID=1353778 RepID=A0A328WL68_9FLAO|nr:hypothetical protein [Flavobacterium lacus]RAR46991.1 hypothetical protein B0I10_1124 [Flavobacterium lacus]
MNKFLQLLLLLLIFGSTSVFAQKTWVGATNGTWNTGSNWSPSGVPGAGDDVIINTTLNISVNTNTTINTLTITGNAAVTFTANGGARTITIDNTGSSIDAGSSLTLVGTTGGGSRTMRLAYTGSNQTMAIAGTLILTPTAAGSIYTATNSVTTVTGSIVRTGGTLTSTASNLSFSAVGTYQHAMNGSTIPTATWNANSTCLVTGITSTIPSAGLGQAFGNFTWNCSGQSAAINNLAGASGGLTTINGDFTILSTNGQTLNLNNSATARTLTVGGNFSNSGGVIDWASGTATTTINVGGAITVSGSATMTTSTLTTAVVNGTFVLTGSTPQTLNFSTPSNVTYTNFTVNTASTLVLGSDVFLNRNNNAPWRSILTVNNGGTINCGTHVVTGGGLVETNGEFNLNAGAKMITANATGVQGSVTTATVNPTYNSGASYEFRGAATGVFTLSTANTITGTMTINRSSGVTLDQDFTTSTLEFLDGVATTGSFAITIHLTGSITGANASRYINGRLHKVFNAATSFTFPIGKDGVYKPVVYEYTALTGTSTVSMEQFEAALPGTLPSSINLNNSRYWEISQTGGSSIGYQVTLDGAGDAITGTIVMLKRESGTTSSHAVTAPNYTNTTAFTTLTGNNQFTLGSTCTQTASVGSNQSFCSTQAVVLSGNTPTYGSGAWSVAGPSTLLAQFSDVNSPTATFTPAGGNGIYTLTWTLTNGNCSNTATQDLEYGKSTTWTVASGGSWNNGAPDVTTSAIISFDYTSSGDLVACSLTVDSNADVIISSGDVVSLSGGLTVDTGSSFTLENDAYLMQEGSSNPNSGDITVERQSQSLMRLDYTLWSSPVESQNLLSFSPLTVANRFYTYTTSANTYAVIAPGSNDFTTGQGYLIRMPDNHPTSPTAWQGSFVGKPNSGDLAFTLSNAGSGYNAVGNPYPSPISIETFLDDNSSLIDGDLYFWRKTNNAAGSAYVTYSGGAFSDGPHPYDNIQPGQGFIVKANSAGNLAFNNLQREVNSGVFYRSEENSNASRIWLHLKNNSTVVGALVVGYREDATNGIDNQLDGEYINDSSLSLNSVVADTALAVQHRAGFVSTDVVPLQFKTNNSGSFEIAINTVDGLFLNDEQHIFLKDNLLNVAHDLRNAAYSFVSDAGTFSNRFEIVYESTLSVSSPLLENTVVVYSKNKTIEINSGSIPMNNVKVFDMRGRLVAEQSDVAATSISLPLERVANQVLIVQITSIDGQTSSKKVVH